MERVARARRWPTVAAVAVVGLAAAATVTAVVLDAAVAPAHRAAIGVEAGWTDDVAGLGLAVPGALLLYRLPRHPVAWVLCLAGVQWCLDGVAGSWLAYATARHPALPGAALAFWVFMRFGAWLLLSLPLLLLLYPDGRLPTGRWRAVALASLAATAVLPLVVLVVPSEVAQAAAGGELPEAFRGLDLDPTSVALPTAVWSPLLAIGYATVPLSLLVPFAVVVRRYRAATAAVRARMRWLVWAALVDVLLVLALAILPPGWATAALFVAVGLTGLAVAVGIARPQVVDIDRMLRGTLLYAALAAAVVGVDAAVLAATGALLGERLAERNAALFALLVVMVVYGPARHRLWRLGRRLLRGRRDDPYRLVAGLAEQLERSDSPQQQLLAVARSVAEGFGYRYVAVEVDHSDGQRLLAEHGHRPAVTQELPITYRGEQVGRLLLPRHGPRASLSGRDERLLADVVRQAAAAARASHLARQLQHSREQLVAAREEERRRLRRDLHDGLGPSLGAVALRIDTARNLLRASTQQADVLLRQARDDTAAALADVRRLVHDLRPRPSTISAFSARYDSSPSGSAPLA